MKCKICGEEYSENYYKEEMSGEIICEECLLELDGITTNTVTSYFIEGDFIGDDSESIQEVVENICEYFSYEKIEEENQC